MLAYAAAACCHFRCRHSLLPFSLRFFRHLPRCFTPRHATLIFFELMPFRHAMLLIFDAFADVRRRQITPRHATHAAAHADTRRDAFDSFSLRAPTRFTPRRRCREWPERRADAAALRQRRGADYASEACLERNIHAASAHARMREARRRRRRAFHRPLSHLPHLIAEPSPRALCHRR